jgi:ribonuclease HI
MPKLTVNFDGGSRGNPGPAAIGAVVSNEDGEIVVGVGEQIGRGTNNVAEYRALLRGIELAKEQGATEVEIIGDSKVVVQQVLGNYKVKKDHLKVLRAEVMDALEGFDSWTISEVRRAFNAEADRLVNEAFDG